MEVTFEFATLKGMGSVGFQDMAVLKISESFLARFEGSVFSLP